MATDAPVVVRARIAPQMVVLAAGIVFVVGGVLNWSSGGTLSESVLKYLATVAALTVGGVAWFRAFRLEITPDHVDFRSLWRRRRWRWAEVSHGYVARQVASGARGALRPVFRLTLHHRDGSYMDIPYNVFGLRKLDPLKARLDADGKLRRSPAD